MTRHSDDITASSMLPARREDIELHTADGLTLVGELAVPVEREPAGTLVTLHPLPTHGGFMDSHVFKKAAYRLPAVADLAVLRFNLRGVTSPRGHSQGAFDGGHDERFDVASAIEFVEFHETPKLPNRWLVGWSFGTDLTLMHGCDPSIAGAILLSPPLRFTLPKHLRAWADSGKPVIALIPEYDDYLRPEEARRKFAAIPQAEVIAVEGAKHLWVGEPYVRRVHEEIVARVNPTALPLATTWPAAEQRHEPRPKVRFPKDVMPTWESAGMPGDGSGQPLSRR